MKLILPSNIPVLTKKRKLSILKKALELYASEDRIYSCLAWNASVAILFGYDPKFQYLYDWYPLISGFIYQGFGQIDPHHFNGTKPGLHTLVDRDMERSTRLTWMHFLLTLVEDNVV